MADVSVQTGDGSASAAPAADSRDVFYRSSDGLRLHVVEYGDRLSPFLPVICLPGLTRTARDFDELARKLASDPRRVRRVLVFDYRGRGRSAWDPRWENYTPLTEMSDVLDGMVACAVSRAVIVGTSRGGIIGMLMAVARPAVVAALVLNDVGPVLDPAGMARIKAYVGRTPLPDTWTDAVAILKRLHEAQFPALSEADWQAYARTTWREEQGRLVSDHDPSLARTLDGLQFDRPMPSLWNEFRAVSVPVLAIRGEHSQLLSPETLAAMEAASPHCETMTVAGQGHAPLLRGEELPRRIGEFIARVEGKRPPAEAIVPRMMPTFTLDAAKED
jgi:pimeloyl-ACP methyl ester carboxylesterase